MNFHSRITFHLISFAGGKRDKDVLCDWQEVFLKNKKQKQRKYSYCSVISPANALPERQGSFYKWTDMLRIKQRMISIKEVGKLPQCTYTHWTEVTFYMCWIPLNCILWISPRIPLVITCRKITQTNFYKGHLMH